MPRFSPSFRRCLFALFVPLFLGLQQTGAQQAGTGTTTGTTTGTGTGGGILKKVLERGRLHCGVAAGISGFARRDEGTWYGMDIDLCRAVAAAALGSPDKIRIVPTTSSDRFDLLQAGDIDVLFRSSAWTANRDLGQGLRFAGVNFFNGLTLMINTGLGTGTEIASLADLDGREICTTGAPAQTDALAFELSRKSVTAVILKFASSEETQQAYEAGRCPAILGEVFSLALRRRDLTNPENHILLQDYISLEPLGPVVAGGDKRWADFVAWVVYALISAEEQGLTDDRAALHVPGAAVFFKGSASFSDPFELPVPNPLYNAIAATGHYGQIFERNFAGLLTDRGPNALWRDGGLLYAPGFR